MERYYVHTCPNCNISGRMYITDEQLKTFENLHITLKCPHCGFSIPLSRPYLKIISHNN